MYNIKKVRRKMNNENILTKQKKMCKFITLFLVFYGHKFGPKSALLRYF